MTTRAKLHHLIDALPEESLVTAERFLTMLQQDGGRTVHKLLASGPAPDGVDAGDVTQRPTE